MLCELSGAAPTPGTTWSSGEVGVLVSVFDEHAAAKRVMAKAIAKSFIDFMIVGFSLMSYPPTSRKDRTSK